jgi:ribosomal protein L40E
MASAANGPDHPDRHMICIRCGQTNPDQANYCEKCNAALPKVASERPPGQGSTIAIEEGYQFLKPQKSYVTAPMFELTARAWEFLEHGASGEPVMAAYDAFKAGIDDFERVALPHMMAGLENLSAQHKEDTYPKQMRYLLHRGMALMREGFELMERFKTSYDREDMRNSVFKLQEGNDYLGTALEFNAEMQTLTLKVLDDINKRLSRR